MDIDVKLIACLTLRRGLKRDHRDSLDAKNSDAKKTILTSTSLSILPVCSISDNGESLPASENRDHVPGWVGVLVVTTSASFRTCGSWEVGVVISCSCSGTYENSLGKDIMNYTYIFHAIWMHIRVWYKKVCKLADDQMSITLLYSNFTTCMQWGAFGF